jgi:hypothetical protein
VAISFKNVCDAASEVRGRFIRENGSLTKDRLEGVVVHPFERWSTGVQSVGWGEVVEVAGEEGK